MASSQNAAGSGMRERPLSPHLSVYRPYVTMTMSILHRITGGALYVGTLLVVWWLVAAASGPAYFDLVSEIFGSWLGRLVLFGYTWALMHHMLGGLRHFLWDTGRAFTPKTADMLAWANLAGSAALTLVVWVAGYMAMG